MSHLEKTGLSRSPSEWIDTVRVRRARPEDLGFVYRLALACRHLYCHDHMEILPETLQAEIGEGRVLILEVPAGPVGCISHSAPVGNLHCEVHALIVPRYLAACLRQRVLESVIDRLFYLLDVQKLKARCLITQRSARKLLARLKFKQSGIFRNEVAMQGRPVDMLAFELHRRYWERFLQQKEENTP